MGHVVQLHADCHTLVVSSTPVLHAHVIQLHIDYHTVIACPTCFANIPPEPLDNAAEAYPDVHITTLTTLGPGSTHANDSSSVSCFCFQEIACNDLQI